MEFSTNNENRSCAFKVIISKFTSWVPFNNGSTGLPPFLHLAVPRSRKNETRRYQRIKVGFPLNFSRKGYKCVTCYRFISKSLQIERLTDNALTTLTNDGAILLAIVTSGWMPI